MGLSASLLAPLDAGAIIVTLPRPDTELALALIAEHGVTHATLPPPMIEAIAARDGALDLPALQLAVTAGTHVPAAVQERAGERLGCPVRQGYGMTEACPISGPFHGLSDPASVGWFAPGLETRIEAGELWIRGPQVAGDGWLRTGDLVDVRDDGQVVIVDRLKELIKVDGLSVAPAELELVLREHPAVRDAGVVGRPDPRRGEVPVAYVVGEDPRDLIEFVNARVAPHKALHDVRVVGALPRAPNGKLQRRALREQARESVADHGVGR